jgi:hypothetical protein
MAIHDTQSRTGTYTGALWQLKGKTADLICYPTGQCLAQFHERETGYGDGKHAFNTGAFDLDEPLDWSGGEDLG